jgi:hypothetical protein
VAVASAGAGAGHSQNTGPALRTIEARMGRASGRDAIVLSKPLISLVGAVGLEPTAR